jgi:hypothetical protein
MDFIIKKLPKALSFSVAQDMANLSPSDESKTHQRFPIRGRTHPPEFTGGSQMPANARAQLQGGDFH